MGGTLANVGTFLQSFLGNGGPAASAGLAEAVNTGTLSIRANVLKALNKAGQSLGPVLGKAIPESIAAGAAQRAPNVSGTATAAGYSFLPTLEKNYLGVSVSNSNLVLILGGGAIGVWALWTALKR